MGEELKEHLNKIIKRYDTPNVRERINCDAASDNTGDVYSAGCEYGMYSLAKEIIDQFLKD